MLLELIVLCLEISSTADHVFYYYGSEYDIHYQLTLLKTMMS